jgi:hypothetical protein
MNGESIDLGFLLIDDPNLQIILNDPDVSMSIKNAIAKLKTDKLYISKLSNPVQKDDFKLEAKKTYRKEVNTLITNMTILIDTFKIRKKDGKRFDKYLIYLKKVF